MGRHQVTNKRQKAIEIARVLKLELANLSEINPAARRDMLDVIDDLIAALQDG